MNIEVDEDGEMLWLDDEEFMSSGDRRFEVLASCLRNAMLSDIPCGDSVRLCSRVIGSNDLFGRNSFWFEHTKDDLLIAHAETLVVVEDENLEWGVRAEFLKSALDRSTSALGPLLQDESLVDLSDYVDEDEGVGYLYYSVMLPDQPIYDAESFMEAIEARVYDGLRRPLLFICHASEDKPFVERLVTQLDRRALHAWYDTREILVGDSIVAKINEGLSQARYVVAILSRRSIVKPWVTRELNSSLMRQLAAEKVAVLPALLEDCDIPPLLADLKYADFRESFDHGFAALLQAIRQRG